MVAEDTVAGTPMLISIGLKTEPPPIPKAPETQPPTKDKTKSLIRTFP